MYNAAEEAMRQYSLSAQDKNRQYTPPMTNQQKTISALAKAQASRDNNMNTEDWKAEEQEMKQLGFQDAANNAASQIRKTEPTYNAPASKPKQNVQATTQFKAVVDANPVLDDAMGQMTQEDTQEIQEAYEQGNINEDGTPNVPGIVKRHKDIPWDVIATVASGIGAMMGLTPMIDFTRFGFDVTNRRNERVAESQGRQTALDKKGQGDVINANRATIDAYTEQAGNENLAQNKAAMNMKDKELQNQLALADKQLEASFNELGLKLATEKELAQLDANTKKEIQNLINKCQKELADAGYEHSEKMPKLMASAQYAAYLDAKAKGFDKDFAEWMRNNEGKAFWEAGMKSAGDLLSGAASVVGSVMK